MMSTRLNHSLPRVAPMAWGSCSWGAPGVQICMPRRRSMVMFSGRKALSETNFPLESWESDLCFSSLLVRWSERMRKVLQKDPPPPLLDDVCVACPCVECPRVDLVWFCEPLSSTLRAICGCFLNLTNWNVSYSCRISSRSTLSHKTYCSSFSVDSVLRLSAVVISP